MPGRSSSVVGAAVGFPMSRGMAILIEHFGLLPGLLLTTEIGGKRDGKGS